MDDVARYAKERWEELARAGGDVDAGPGTWAQLSAAFPPWLSIWAELDPRPG